MTVTAAQDPAAGKDPTRVPEHPSTSPHAECGEWVRECLSQTQVFSSRSPQQQLLRRNPVDIRHTRQLMRTLSAKRIYAISVLKLQR